METDELIQRIGILSQSARPLPRVWKRTVLWLLLGVPYVALVVLVMSPRADLGLKFTEARFVIEQLAALLTGVTGAAAAFASTIPGFDRRDLMAPILPLGIWLGSLGQGCIDNWLKRGWESFTLQPDWFCLPAIVLVGAVPAIILAVMLRRGAPLTPHLTVALGGLAAGGVGNFGLRLFHSQDASLMVLVWQMGTVLLVTALAGIVGRHLLSWQATVAFARAAVLGGKARSVPADFDGR